ncbi:MAG: RDD family protein, partial [Candidatus Obscuribacterales bacterium]|nr:RDD family protein [Candidatus Obscuribacterales bacterium]
GVDGELSNFKLASFPRRIAASIIDGILVGTVCLGLTLVVICSVVSFPNFLIACSMANGLATIAVNCIEVLLFGIILLALPSLFFGYCESSDWQATPGKRLMNLQIVGTSGERLSFWNASRRMFLAEVFVSAFVGLPVLAALSFYKFMDLPVPIWMYQEIHIIELIVGLAGLTVALFSQKRQTLLDILTKRVVIQSRRRIDGHLLSPATSGASRRRLLVPAAGSALFVLVPAYMCIGTFFAPQILPGYSARAQAEFDSKKADLEAKMQAKGTVVYAIRDISEGELIPFDSLEEKEIRLSKIPQGALTSLAQANDHWAKYGIAQGQIVSQYDLGTGRTLKIRLSKEDFELFIKSGGNEDLAEAWIMERIRKEKPARSLFSFLR